MEEKYLMEFVGMHVITIGVIIFMMCVIYGIGWGMVKLIVWSGNWTEWFKQ